MPSLKDLITFSNCAGHNLTPLIAAQMIYWVGHKVIERCTYTDTNRQLLIDETADEGLIAAVAVDDIYIYYSVLEARYDYDIQFNSYFYLSWQEVWPGRP